MTTIEQLKILLNDGLNLKANFLIVRMDESSEDKSRNYLINSDFVACETWSDSKLIGRKWSKNNLHISINLGE